MEAPEHYRSEPKHKHLLIAIVAIDDVVAIAIIDGVDDVGVDIMMRGEGGAIIVIVIVMDVSVVVVVIIIVIVICSMNMIMIGYITIECDPVIVDVIIYVISIISISIS